MWLHVNNSITMKDVSDLNEVRESNFKLGESGESSMSEREVAPFLDCF